MKYIKPILLAASLISSYSYACVGMSVNNQVLNAKEASIPFWNKDAGTYTNFFISNTSNKDIEVKLDLMTYDGSVYSNAIIPFNREFSGSNSPINAWATIGAKKVDVIQIPKGGANVFGQATISWRDSECLDTPITVTTWQGFNNNTDISILSVKEL